MHWIVIHLVRSCDVSGTDRATLHMLLPINLLKRISNATLGASADLSSYHRHTLKQNILFSSPLLVKKSEFGRQVRCQG